MVYTGVAEQDKSCYFTVFTPLDKKLSNGAGKFRYSMAKDFILKKGKNKIRKIRKFNGSFFIDFGISQFRNFILFTFIFCLSITFSLYSSENVPVPLGHWSYPILEYFATERILKINLETKPVTREDVRLALEEVKERYVNGKLKIDAVEDDLLASLYEEFILVSKGDFRNTPKTIYSSKNVIFKEESSIGTEFTKTDEDSDYLAYLKTYLWGNLGKHISFAEQLNILRKKNTGSRDSLGTRAWNDFRGTTPIALFNLSFSHLEINAGRTSNWLGPGRYGTLLLSNNYPYSDEINGVVKLNKLKLSSFFIIMNVDSSKYLSGHRLEISDIWGATFGFNEFVIFSNRLEPGYLNPFLILYGEQYNRGDRDNVFWSFDLSIYLFGKNRLYGEFLIDDFQYESTPPAPNKIGSIIGLHITEPFNLPRLDLLMEYTRIAKWVYTHKYPENTYSNYSLCIGHPFGPDSDGFDITLREFFRWNIIPKVHFGYRRKGEGRIYEPWEKEIDPNPSFPSGIVESTILFDVSIFLKPFPSSEFVPGWRTYRTENLHNVQDWTEQDNEFFINILLTF